MLGKIWKFAREPLNLALILAIASGIGWAWHELKPAKGESPATATNNASPADRSIVTGDVNQTATAAGNSSHAINAAPGATVSISGADPAK